MAESRMLPDTPIRRVAATIAEEEVSNCGGEKSLLAHSRERQKRQPVLLPALAPFEAFSSGLANARLRVVLKAGYLNRWP
jgi:hypothetical protein